MSKPHSSGYIKAQIRGRLRLNGWVVFDVMQGPLSHPGVSNLIGVKCGVVAFMEIKTERGCVSDPQKRFQDDLESRGGHYFILRSLEDAEAMERKLDMNVAGVSKW
jgi:hypothetical protein